MQREFREALQSISTLQRLQLDIVNRTLEAAYDAPALAPSVYRKSAEALVGHRDTSVLPQSTRRRGFADTSAERNATGLVGAHDPSATVLGDYKPFAAPPFSLTPRELETLKLIMQSKTNKEIARLLGVSPRTVEVHRANAMHKLGAQNAVHLVRIVWGVFRP